MKSFSFLSRAIIFLICTSLFSCNFQPDGIVITPITPPTAEGIVINLKGYPEQNIYLKNITQFNYEINAEGRQLVNTEVTLDNTVINSSGLSGTFSLNPADYTPGTHKLKITYVAKSGSGSLADTYDGERLFVWIERDVIITPAPGEPGGQSGEVKISNVENVDGTVRITWTKSASDGFESYALIRTDFDRSGTYLGSFNLTSVSDVATTSVDDHTYLPGKSEYKIFVTTRAVNYETSPYIYKYNYDPDFHNTTNKDGTVTVRWRSLYSLRSNFTQYNLLIQESNNYDHAINFDRSNVMDTSITFSPDGFALGTYRPMKLTLLRNPSLIESPPAFYSRLGYGDSFPKLYAFFGNYPAYNADRKQYYLYYFNRLRRADEKGQLIDSTTNRYNSVRIAKDFAIATTETGEYMKIDLQTMEESPLTLPMPYLLDLANDGTMACGDGTNVGIYSRSGVKLKDMTVYTFGGLSRDGSYLVASLNMNKFDGTNYVPTFSYFDNDNYIRKSMMFIPEVNPTKVVFSFRNKMTVMDLTTGGYNTLTTDIHGPCNYDPFSNKFGCLSGDRYVILNAEDYSIYKSVPVVAGINSDEEYFYLLNSTILCPAGAQIKLSDLP